MCLVFEAPNEIVFCLRQGEQHGRKREDGGCASRKVAGRLILFPHGTLLQLLLGMFALLYKQEISTEELKRKHRKDSDIPKTPLP